MNSCSLLVPCHNSANYLARLWKTVQAQTIPFDEVIFYDDGSTDDTSEVVKQLGARIIRNRNCRGVSFARNQLAQVTTCDWIHFHDADDILHPNYLERCKASIQHEVDVVVCNADWIDEVSRQVLIPRRYQQRELETNPLRATITNPIGVISCLYRKESFLRINGFDASLKCWEDGDLHVRLAAAGAKFAVVDDVLSFSLRHNRGLSADQNMCNRCRLKLLKQYAQDLDSSLNSVVAEQAEITATNSLQLGDWLSAREAIKLCRSLGKIPPTSNNLLINILKPIIPPILLLKIQKLTRDSKTKKRENFYEHFT